MSALTILNKDNTQIILSRRTKFQALSRNCKTAKINRWSTNTLVFQNSHRSIISSRDGYKSRSITNSSLKFGHINCIKSEPNIARFSMKSRKIVKASKSSLGRTMWSTRRIYGGQITTRKWAHRSSLTWVAPRLKPRLSSVSEKSFSRQRNLQCQPPV